MINQDKWCVIFPPFMQQVEENKNKNYKQEFPISRKKKGPSRPPRYQYFSTDINSSIMSLNNQIIVLPVIS